MADDIKKKSPRLASIPEAVIYGQMSRTKLYSKLNSGQIKARKRDGETMIDLDSIDAYHASLPDWTPSDNSKL